MPPAPVPVPSATLILLRDGVAGLEVLMVERHGQMAFAGGALVFPGGKLDPGDRDPRLRARCSAAELDAEALALRVAAVREAFEECGVLLAGARGEDALVSAARASALASRWRDALAADRVPLAEIAEQEDLWLACDRLVPFAHWITPVEFTSRRFDTWFFLAEAPSDQQATHDGVESVATRWIRPAEAVREAQAGRLPIIFPTLMNLRKLARSERASDALAAAREAPIVTVLPRVERAADGSQHVRIPAEAGYGLEVVPVDALLPQPR